MVQPSLFYTPTEPVLHSNGALIALQQRLRCNITKAPLECNGASIANRKNRNFRTTLIIRHLQSAPESRISDQRNSWWIIFKNRG